ncbi:GD16413 [Drosophila simulans]|uniref:GD16413 n=1 Tax=Drosophila simulans TaxID=7240 RepID=B4R308_DROSI|nr:GD16413 [Drosophila simulans]
MKPKNETKLPASNCMNKRFKSTLMRSPEPSFAMSNGMKKKTVSFSRFIRDDRAAGGRPTNWVKKKTVSRRPLGRAHLSTGDLAHQLASMSLNNLPSMQPRRRNSITNEFLDDPPKPAFNCRSSLVRRNSINLPIEANFAMSVLMGNDDDDEEEEEEPATSTSQDAIPKPPKNFGFIF